tara:strand:- start:375 stop:500 length:126 start_codon:yes stop_codon:yes gene_type:complete
MIKLPAGQTEFQSLLATDRHGLACCPAVPTSSTTVQLLRGF